MRDPTISKPLSSVAEDLRRAVSGEVSWGLGSRRSRAILSTLGYALTLDNAKMVDDILTQVFADLGYKPDVDFTSLRPKEKNRILKIIDKKIRAVDRSLADVLGDRGFESTGLGSVHSVDFGSAIDGSVKTLSDVHQRNRDTGRVRPDYDRDVQVVATALQSGFKMEKPQGSSLHHLIQFMKESPKELADRTMLELLESRFHSFVVEHDWASAFSKSEDFEGGEVSLPFDFTCFEFRINGLRLLVPLGIDGSGRSIGVLVSGVNRNWYINNSKIVFTSDGRLYDEDVSQVGGSGGSVVNGFIDMLGRQIRAVCIMLDAGVARGNRIDPPEALNKKRRQQGKAPLKPYHVVSLTRKHREHHDRGDGTGTHKRLHWRRGHWRHFQQPTGQVQYTDDQGILRSKTWLHWQLVGDPDLGFVDKHYRL